MICIAYVLHLCLAVNMPVISFANPKGGSGKTTLTLVLALELSKQGASLAVIDADPNAVIADWASRRRHGAQDVPFTIVARPKEAEMVATIGELSQIHDFVLIDLEGTASRLLSRAFARSHLILIPLNPSPIDARLAAAAVQLVHEEGEALERSIPFRLVYSCYPAAIATRSFRRIDEEIRAEQLPTLAQGLVERAAFRDIFEFAKTLDELTDETTSGLERARENAHALAQQVVDALKAIQQKNKQ
jgi:chromosome partitioning protein